MIRPYQDSDLNQLLDVWYSASQVGHPFLDDSFFEQERQKIETLYLPQADTWVYEAAGAVVGFVALVGNEVGGLFVAADRQGQGIGRALLDKAASLHPVLELDVFAENKVGRRFYRRYGFQTIGQSRHEPTGRLQLRLRYTSDFAD